MQSLINHSRLIALHSTKKAHGSLTHYDAADIQRKAFLNSLNHPFTRKESVLTETIIPFIRRLLNTPEIPDYHNLSKLNYSVKYAIF
jgi:hypothetical protein